MSAARENTPLVELIVELKWLSPSAPAMQAQNTPILISSPQPSKVDEFFMQFGARIHSHGYTEVERLGVSGFPLMLHQPVFRFRRKQDTNDGSLFQIGPGLFTANAVPPYESWEKFNPIVIQGVSAVIESRPQEEKEQEFIGASLRYIDAFMPRHTGGRDLIPFLEEVLGIKIAIPNAISKHIPSGLRPTPMLQLQVPVEGGFMMNLMVGEGMTPDGPAIMMDTSVSSVAAIPAQTSSVMGALNLAHNLIRETFSDLIKPVDHLMPIKKG